MRAQIAFTLAALLAAPAKAEEAAGQTDDTSGVIAGEWGYVEILPEAPPPGKTIQLQEGWIRVESAPNHEEAGSGSFGVISRDAFAITQEADDGMVTRPQPGLRAGEGYPEELQEEARRQQEGLRRDGSRREPLQQQPAPGRQPGMQAGGPDLGACYDEREAYVERLFEIAEIQDVEHPLALMTALQDTPGLSPWVRFNLFGLPGGGPWAGVTWIEPLRPLAWDDDLQYAARELERCMRLHLGFDDRLVDPDLERRLVPEQAGTDKSTSGTQLMPSQPRNREL